MPFWPFKRRKKENKLDTENIRKEFYTTPSTYGIDINNPKPYTNKTPTQDRKNEKKDKKNKQQNTKKKGKIKTIWDIEEK